MQPNRPNRPRDDSRNRRPYSSRNGSGSENSASSARPRHPDADVDQRIRELDAERDPLSLPEEIVSEANRAGQRVGIPHPSDDGPTLNIAQLQAMTRDQLNQLATK